MSRAMLQASVFLFVYGVGKVHSFLHQLSDRIERGPLIRLLPGADETGTPLAAGAYIQTELSLTVWSDGGRDRGPGGGALLPIQVGVWLDQELASESILMDDTAVDMKPLNELNIADHCGCAGGGGSGSSNNEISHHRHWRWRQPQRRISQFQRRAGSELKKPVDNSSQAPSQRPSAKPTSQPTPTPLPSRMATPPPSAIPRGAPLLRAWPSELASCLPLHF